MPDKTTIEVMIRAVVYDAALARAKSQAQQVRTIAREVMFDRAAQAEPNEFPAHPTARVLGQPARRRLRFRAVLSDYTIARKRLHASGVSVTAAIEEGLERYARTGEFK